MITVRTATAEDAATLALLHASSFADSWSEKLFQNILSSSAVFGLLASEGDASVGLILARVAAEEAEVLTLAVPPLARRQGVARRLVGAAADRAAERGAERFFLEVAAKNRAARGLYGKLGFREVGCRPGYYRDEDGLIMRADFPLSELGNEPEVD